MRTVILLTATLLIGFLHAEETLLLRHPDYNNGRLVFSYMGDIWIWDGKGVARRLTVHPASDVMPRFSPDGRWIAFTSNRCGNWDVFVIPAEGGKPRQLTFRTGIDVVVTWTPDSRFVVFKTMRGSVFRYRLFKVSIDGGIPEPLLPCSAAFGTFSQDGQIFAFNRRSPYYSRKRYRGSNNTEIWLYNFKTKKFKRLTKNDYHDNSPLLAGDWVVYASEKDGVFNLYALSLKNGKVRKLTEYTDEPVRYPSISADRRYVVYEQGFKVWRLDLQTGKTDVLRVEVRSDWRRNPITYKEFRNRVHDFSVSPDNRCVAVSVYGDLFLVPLEKGDMVRLTEGPARDRKPVFSPNGEQLAFVSDRSGREEVYIINLKTRKITKVTDSDTLKSEIVWSPDGTKLAVAESDHTLNLYDVKTGKKRTLLKDAVGRPRHIHFLADGRWLVYTKPNRDWWTDIYLMRLDGKEPKEYRIADDMPFDEWSINCTKEAIYFLSEEYYEGDGHWKVAAYKLPLRRLTCDPDDPEASRLKKYEKFGKKGREKTQKKQEEKVAVDVEGMRKRIRKLFEVAGRLREMVVSKDGHIVVLVKEARGKKERNVLYYAGKDGKELRKLTAVGRVRRLRFSPDGKYVFYQIGKELWRIPRMGGAPRRVTFRVEVRVDRAAERRQILNECWRIMKHVFYDAKMHGVDWDAVRKKYNAILPYVADKEALGSIIERMFGELSASHMGMYVPEDVKPTCNSRHLGFDLVKDIKSGLYRVGHILKDGPADREWLAIREGDYVLRLDGKPLRVPDNYWKILNHLINPYVEVEVAASPDGKDRRKLRIKHISLADARRLRYKEWVERNRRLVEKKSGGRLAYIHIPSMEIRSLHRFRRELMRYRLKDGIVLDVRYNTGGYIDEYLLDVLERRPYYKSRFRDSVFTTKPWNGFFGKLVLLINQFSFSDAELFPHGFRVLGLGKLVGVPTSGGCIGTGSYRLVDGSRMRTPYNGIYTLDGRTLENMGVKPDIWVEETPEDEAAQRDPQLEAAVKVLLEELQTRKKGK